MALYSGIVNSMAMAPLLNYFDGTGTTANLTITTNVLGLILTGVIDSNVIDVQIDINGSGFVSDPTLVDIGIEEFTIPNLSSYPDGLVLDRGLNVIRLRAIDTTGSASPITTAVVTVVADTEMQVIQAPPTGVILQRRANSIELSWVVPQGDDSGVSGYNVYASTSAGGSGSGYLRVNQDLIPASSPTKTVENEFILESVSYDLTDSSGGADIQISSKFVDPASGVILQTTSQNEFSLIGSPNVRMSVSVSNLSLDKAYTFDHSRDAGVGAGILNNDTFSVIDSEDPLFYVITAVYFDKFNGVMQESRFSQELSGAPLPIDTTIRGIRTRDQSRVAQDWILEIQKTEPTLAMIPGSTVREVHVEPFSNEIQKAYFLMDFVHRSKSFPALLQIDDPGFTGTSITVANSSYKQQLRSAVSLDSDSAVQQIIDSAFDSLAQNYGVIREGLRAATVVQTFFTLVKPTKDLNVIQGAVVISSKNKTAPRFRSKGSAIIPAASAQSFYNQALRRYEIQVQLVAETAGASGNVSAGDLDSVVSGADGLQTVNEVASDFGRNVQSNLDLAETALRALYSLDTGTEGGYQRVAIGTPGLLEVNIIKSGDPYMMRDWDEVRRKHIGGKVDIYVKGTLERTVSETFAFQFERALNIRFDVMDPLTLTLRARDSRLSPSNPITEILFNPAQNLGFRNHSLFPTASYDLTGAVIIDYRTIRLSTAIPQPSTLLDDFVEGDYRYRANNKFTASVQPIRRITSVSGSASGPLDPVVGFGLFKLEDPLLYGESTQSSDFVSINQVGSVPSGEPIIVNDEPHVLIGQFEERLESVGINLFTITVFNRDRTLTYAGPDTPNPDYLLVGGSQTEPVKIVRTVLSNIVNGSTISVDYQHDENFTVVYVVNDVLEQLQLRVSSMRHVTADVLVKQGLENPMTTEFTVQLSPNAVQSTVDSSIRNGTTVLADSRGIGKPIHQSDVIAVVDDANGVDFMVQPFTRFSLKDGAVRIREEVASESVFIPSLSFGTAAVYLLTEPLPFDTVDGGGIITVHHGVFIDNLIMVMADSLDLVGSAPGQSWIIGKLGAVIPGISDDATLLPLFPNPDALAAERARRTGNRVVVSLDASVVPPDSPDVHGFSATYIVEDDHNAKDIEVSSIEYLTPGDQTITYRSA